MVFLYRDAHRRSDMTTELELKLESGSLDWSDAELAQLPEHWREQVEADIAEEAEHQALLAD